MIGILSYASYGCQALRVVEGIEAAEIAITQVNRLAYLVKT